MCHLILFLPILALPVFWLFPLAIAGPLYAGVVVFSLMLYRMIFNAMHKRPETGREALVHAAGVVEGVVGDALSVRIHGEHWTAHCADERLAPGDPVEVVSIHGLTLDVTRGED